MKRVRGASSPAFYLLSIIVLEQLVTNLLLAAFVSPQTWHHFVLFLLFYSFKDTLFAGLLAFHNTRFSRCYIYTLVASALLSVFCAGMINYGHNDLAHLIRHRLNIGIVAAQLVVVVCIIRRQYVR